MLPTCNQGIDVATGKRVGRRGWGYVMMPRAPLLPRAVGNWRRTLLSNCFSRRHDITTRLAGGGPVAMCCWSLHTAATTPTLVWVTQSWKHHLGPCCCCVCGGGRDFVSGGEHSRGVRMFTFCWRPSPRFSQNKLPFLSSQFFQLQLYTLYTVVQRKDYVLD